MKRFFLIAIAAFAVTSGVAGASPQPSSPPSSAAGRGTACSSIFEQNPNASGEGHQSPQGGSNFEAVGETFCL